MDFDIKFNKGKNELLKSTRGISFENVVSALKENHLLADTRHPSQKHKNQRLYVVKISNYAYVVPYVLNLKKKEVFLKTIYPSRRYTKLYIGRKK